MSGTVHASDLVASNRFATFPHFPCSDSADCAEESDKRARAATACLYRAHLEGGGPFIWKSAAMRGRRFVQSCWLYCLLPLVCLLSLAGCSLVLPEVSHKPVIRNPFPQLSRVAVAPFFNHSNEPTLDGRVVTMAYFAELQTTPGFEVLPLNVVEEAIIANRINLSGPGEARRLAQLLDVDAVVVGAVTDYSPYYPPRIGMHVEWYTANPGYHEIPVGYGLPWNTPEEEYIPDSLVYESQMALARAQMATQAPDCDAGCRTLPSPPRLPLEGDGSGSKNDPFEDRQRQACAAYRGTPSRRSRTDTRWQRHSIGRYKWTRRNNRYGRTIRCHRHITTSLA